MRLALLTGRFQYSPRGILDETHVHLYTRDSFRDLVENAGYRVTKEDWTVIPIEKIAGGAPAFSKATALFDSLQYSLARSKPELFAYQFVVQAEPA